MMLKFTPVVKQEFAVKTVEYNIKYVKIFDNSNMM